MAELIAEGTGTLGTQAVVKYPHNGAIAVNRFWVNHLNITSETQLTPAVFVIKGNIENGCDSPDDPACAGCAKLYGYNCGYEWIYCEISSADGETGTEAGWITVYYSYFN